MSDLEKLSLQNIDVQGNVIGKFSMFSLLQEYTNKTDTVLEVTYSFPISATATVTGFTAQIGEKIIKGKVKEKEEAQKEYEKAMVRGDSAYLMTNEESNIFRMNIGKIAVGETVIVKVDYIDNFEIVDNQIRMIIPTLIPPRYKSDVTDQLSYAKNEVEYRGNVTICLDKDLRIEDVLSKTHSIKLENNTITAKDIKLDKDFVLDIRLAEQSFSKGYTCDLPNGRKVVYLSFFPAIEMEQKQTPKDYIFVIDISGSMAGYKLEQTKEAVIRCLKQLREGDRFNIIIFDTRHELFAETIMDFNQENYKKVKKYVQALRPRGGTELFSAVKTAVEQFGDKKIIFLFTDGEVGNEHEIAGYVRQHIGKSVLFVFGIDTSVNKNGLQAIAEAGRGKAEFIVREEVLKDIIIRQFARVSSSNLFETGLNPKSNKVKDKIEKQQMMFNHEFYDVLIETDTIVDDFELQCKTDTQTYSFVVSKDALAQIELPLDKIYAAEQIRRVEKYIATRPYEENKGYKEQIVDIAVEYQIDSKYTSFIAVNERDDKLTDIPELQETVLESPAGWDMSMNLRRGKTLYYKSSYAPVIAEPAVLYDCMEETRVVSGRENSGFSPGKMSPKQSRFKSLFHNLLKKEQDVEEDELERIFQKVKDCETMLIEEEKIVSLAENESKASQPLLDEIIELLKLHYTCDSRAFRQWIKKIRKEAPHVFAFIISHLNPQIIKPK